jgi:hypothetical protein
MENKEKVKEVQERGNCSRGNSEHHEVLQTLLSNKELKKFYEKQRIPAQKENDENRAKMNFTLVEILAVLVIIMILAGIVLAVVMGAKGYAKDVKPFIHLTFKEGSGSKTKGENGHVADLNGCTWTDGFKDKALEFDGYSDYVELNDNSLSSLSNNKGLTVGCRFKLYGHTGSDRVGYLVSKDYQGDGNGDTDSFALCVNENGITAELFSESDAHVAVASKTPLKQNKWYYAGFSYDMETVKLYVNGQLVASAPFSKELNKTSGVPLRIGQCSGPRSRYFYGIIDEVTIYRKPYTKMLAEEGMLVE